MHGESVVLLPSYTSLAPLAAFVYYSPAVDSLTFAHSFAVRRLPLKSIQQFNNVNIIVH